MLIYNTVSLQVLEALILTLDIRNKGLVSGNRIFEISLLEKSMKKKFNANEKD